MLFRSIPGNAANQLFFPLAGVSSAESRVVRDRIWVRRACTSCDEAGRSSDSVSESSNSESASVEEEEKGTGVSSEEPRRGGSQSVLSLGEKAAATLPSLTRDFGIMV